MEETAEIKNESENKDSKIMQISKKYLTKKNIAIAVVTPVVLLPLVYGSIWAYKKFIK